MADRNFTTPKGRPVNRTFSASRRSIAGRRASSTDRLLHATTPKSSAPSDQPLSGLEDMKNLLNHGQKELYRESLTPTAPTATAADYQLNEVLDELLNTEANYLRDITFAVQKFGKPLRELLTAAQATAVFSNLATLLELHANLSQILPQPDVAAPLAVDGQAPAERQKAPGSSRASYAATSVAAKGQAVASAFITMQPYFKSYATYCSNYPYVAGALKKAREAPRVAAFLQGAELTHNVKLLQMLFRPVQRMCVYPLLFQQALKHAPKGHPQHDQFQEAFVGVQQAVTQVRAARARASPAAASRVPSNRRPRAASNAPRR